MYDFFHIICHFVGNVLIWIINLGTKSFDEVIQKDNSLIGLVFIAIVSLVLYSKI
ncbi:hypothetical protein [Flavobacterium sp.]|uniref:hypothetical protein n=1 Tax=Flavobacterium sp. TaxID=239 RepID=UPI0026097773|nr:hypothetical protein [Flavobacterium sp.]